MSRVRIVHSREFKPTLIPIEKSIKVRDLTSISLFACRMFYWPTHHRVSRHGVDSVRRPSSVARHWGSITSCPIVTGSSSIRTDNTPRHQLGCAEECIANLAKFLARTVSNTSRHHFTVNDRPAIRKRWWRCQEHNAIAATIRTTTV